MPGTQNVHRVSPVMGQGPAARPPVVWSCKVEVLETVVKKSSYFNKQMHPLRFPKTRGKFQFVFLNNLHQDKSV